MRRSPTVCWSLLDTNSASAYACRRASLPLTTSCFPILIGRTLLLIRCALLGTIWPLAMSCSSGPSASERLELDRVASWTLPNEFDIGGASTSDEGGLVLWSTNGPELIVLQHDSLHVVDYGANQAPEAVAFQGGEARLSVLAARSGRVLTLSRSGALLRESTLGTWRARGRISSAAFSYY